MYDDYEDYDYYEAGYGDDCFGEEEEDCEPDDSMDGDFDSAMESCGWGYDEQYEHHDYDCENEW